MEALIQRMIFRRRGLAACTPTCATVTQNGRQILFCASKVHAMASIASATVYSIDVPISTPGLTGTDPQAAWREAITAPDASPLSHDEESLHEDLLAQRQRQAMRGISSFDYHAPTEQLVFKASGRLCVAARQNEGGTFAAKPLPSAIEATTSAALQWKIAPDGAAVAYASMGRLAVVDLKKMTVSTISDDEGSTCANILVGVPEFVVQEEFDRYDGFWWRPAVHSTDSEREYALLYTIVDESPVVLVQLPECGLEKIGETHRYPRVGTPNATCALRIRRIWLSETGAIRSSPSERVDITTIWPEAEYCVRCGWASHSVFYTILATRRQDTVRIYSCTLERMFVAGDGQTPHFDLVWEEHAPKAWVNVVDHLQFLGDGLAQPLSFVTSTEQTNFRHIVKVDHNSVIPLTEGIDWMVTDDPIRIDSARDVVFFTSTLESPLETHLYATAMDGSSALTPKRLTEKGSSHTASFSPETDIVIVTSSALSKPTTIIAYRIVGVSLHDVHLVPLTQLWDAQLALAPLLTPDPPTTLEPSGRQVPGDAEVAPPEIVPVPLTSGDSAWMAVFKPLGKGPFPTVMWCYGGPHVQLVKNHFSLAMNPTLRMLVRLGYAVGVLDGRGSARRGAAWERAIAGTTGMCEVEDQCSGAAALVHMGIAIKERVGIFGWSYGGYLSFMCLCKRPDIFRIAVVGAPVTDWRLYDTAYTERYMGLPSENPHGYEASAIASYAKHLPNEPGRLLLLHGLKDENVHFTHTAEAVNFLIKHGKPYELQVYPNDRHGVQDTLSLIHMEQRFFHFVLSNL